jgi:hypothetical protein
MQHLDIKICATPEEASKQGHVYEEDYKILTLKQAVVVKKGTQEGNSTVDLIFEDMDGKKYVALCTSNIIKSIPAFTS